jgi:hypothetical protein
VGDRASLHKNILQFVIAVYKFISIHSYPKMQQNGAKSESGAFLEADESLKTATGQCKNALGNRMCK